MASWPEDGWGEVIRDRCRLDGLTWSLLSKAIHSRANRDPPGVARLQSPPEVLSRIHAVAFARGAAERAEREAGHEFFNVGNHSPNGD